MNRAEIVRNVANSIGLSQVDVSRVFERTLLEIKKALSDGKSVELRGFGTFKCVHRSARKAMNPRTGEAIDVESKVLPSFKPSPKLRDAVKSVKKK